MSFQSPYLISLITDRSLIDKLSPYRRQRKVSDCLNKKDRFPNSLLRSDAKVRFGPVRQEFLPNPEPNFGFSSAKSPNPEPKNGFGSVRFGRSDAFLRRSGPNRWVFPEPEPKIGSGSGLDPNPEPN